ncbi:MAG: hypothetical protein Q8934_08800 [Bacillota bacterium]|nr:hypothetical protein [Bacillota bacterium]
MIEDTDKNIIHQYILFQYLERVVDRDRKVILSSKIKFHKPYEHLFSEIDTYVFEQMKELKKQMSKRGLKIINEEREDDFTTEFQYLCRGYQSVFRFWNIALRNQVESLYSKLLISREL